MGQGVGTQEMEKDWPSRWAEQWCRWWNRGEKAVVLGNRGHDELVDSATCKLDIQLALSYHDLHSSQFPNPCGLGLLFSSWPKNTPGAMAGPDLEQPRAALGEKTGGI